MTNYYHAQPYNFDAKGFFFKTLEEYDSNREGLIDSFGQPVEEFELQFIDGDNLSCRLFTALGISQGSLHTWFEEIETLDSWEQLVACYLAEDGYSLENILDACFEDIHFFEGTVEDYAYDYIDSSGLLNDLPKTLKPYFDYRAFARDLVLSGDITEWTSPEGIQYIVTLL